MTVRGIDLIHESTPTQLDMFMTEEQRQKRAQAERSIFDIRRRFGDHAVQSACLLGDLHMPNDGRDEVVMPGLMFR